MMANNMIYRDHIETPCSLGIVLGNTALGTVFLDTLPQNQYIPTNAERMAAHCFKLGSIVK